MSRPETLTLDRLQEIIDPHNKRILAQAALRECVKAMSKIVSNAVRIDGRVSISEDAFTAVQSALARGVMELSR
jgi:hypothetical protein